MSKEVSTETRERIRNRFEQTYKRLENYSIKELRQFLKDKYATYIEDKKTIEFRLSSTDKLAIHKLIQMKGLK